MAAEILMRHFGVDLLGRECGQVAYDVHVRRVFLRSGLAEEDSPEAIEAAACRAYPDSPGTLGSAGVAGGSRDRAGHAPRSATDVGSRPRVREGRGLIPPAWVSASLKGCSRPLGRSVTRRNGRPGPTAAWGRSRCSSGASSRPRVRPPATRQAWSVARRRPRRDPTVDSNASWASFVNLMRSRVSGRSGWMPRSGHKTSSCSIATSSDFHASERAASIVRAGSMSGRSTARKGRSSARVLIKKQGRACCSRTPAG